MKTSIENCLHLNVAIVNEIHEEAIAQFGGINGIRYQALLESAISATQASFAGVSPFTDVIDVAGAYLFYLCSNHPYLDGNMRVGLGACLVFLQLNGFTPAPDSDDWENLTLAVAAGVLAREEVTERLRVLVS
jgi:death on curing protein